MLRLSCVDSVLADMHHSLGPVPADQAGAYNLTRELYGTTRMLLACLPRADLAKVGSYRMLCMCTVKQTLSQRYGSLTAFCTMRLSVMALTTGSDLQVCCGWRCDMYEALQPLRALRPCNSGPGFDESVVLELRALNFDVPPSTALQSSQTLSKL